MINPRAGHCPSFGIEILYLFAGMILGWPVAIPVIFITEFLSEHFEFQMNTTPVSIVCWSSVFVGMYVHYKIWAFLISALKGWRK